MRNYGKKMFPGKNNSNIFFVDNTNRTNINQNNYINQNNKYKNNRSNNIFHNENNPNLINRNINNNENVKQKSKVSINDNRKRHMSMEIINPINLENNLNKISQKESQINRRKVLYTERSVDCLKPRRVLGDFSARDYLLNKNNAWDKSLTLDGQYNPITEREKRPFRRFSSFSQNEVEHCIKNTNNNKEENKKILSDKFYNKFINKPILIEQNKNMPKNRNRKNNINKIISPPPKEQAYVIKKLNPDNNLIDINEIKKNFSKNGINLISIEGLSNLLVPTNNDSVKIILNSNDVGTNKFHKVEKYIQNKGLKMNEIKNNYHIKFTRGIYPNKAMWKDVTYGGREKFEKLEISSKYEKEQKKNGFHKKNILEKTLLYRDLKYKNNFEIKPKKYNSVEK
jgi:hypothetical protein